MNARKQRAAEVIVALDVPSAAEAFTLADDLTDDPTPPWLKVGLELFTAAGPDVARTLVSKGCRVFLDLKLHDIPTTVARAATAAAQVGVHMLTLHLSGGERMVRAAVEALAACPAPRPLCVGVTLLTSQGPEDLPPGTDPAAHVLNLARKGREWGLDGVVCSGHEAAGVKAACGADFICVTPGIRPAFSGSADDQRRVMTPAEAVAQGADFLVIGRPVTRAIDPVAALRQIRTEITSGPPEAA